MKALSLWQPWATLVAIGAKQIETRSWATSYRGQIAIHATQAFPDEAKQLVFEEPFSSALRGQMAEHEWSIALPRGAIVAVVDLVKCIYVHSDKEKQQYLYTRTLFDDKDPNDAPLIMPPDEPERSFGDYTPGRFAWILENIRQLKVPVPTRGYQQLWEVPDDVAAEVEAQLKEAA